jgi:hypothetical protein
MKKSIFINLVVIIISVIGTFLFIKYDNPLKKIIKIIKNNQNYNIIISSSDTVSKQKDSIRKFFSNDFELTLIPALYNKNTIKTAGILSENDTIQVYEQDDIYKIWIKYNLEEILKGYEPAVDKNNGFYGGLRKIFSYQNNKFAFISLKKKNTECFFTSIINLTKKFEVFRSPCVPDYTPPTVDFNASGGGWIIYKNGILFALGAPTVFGKKTEKLVQDPTSPYGKILFFTNKQLLYGLPNKTNFEIFSTGHRNIQGLISSKKNIIAVEHGPMGGDEINIILKDKNYGWPLYSLGTDYNYNNIYLPFENNSKYKGPIYSFIPSIACSDIIECPEIISNRYHPLTSFLISSLKANSLFIVLIDENDNNRVVSLEKIDLKMRLRQFFKKGNNMYISTDGYGIFKLSFKKIIP